MARRIRDASLETRTARSKLPVRGKPFYKSLAPGLHLGYRRNAGGGRWVARIYIGDQNYRVEVFADADDTADANGTTVLTFWQAQERARALKEELERPVPTAEAAALTVAIAVANYIAKRDKRDARRAGRTVRSDASRRLSRYVLGQEQRGNKQLAVPATPLSSVAMHALTEGDLKAWRKRLPGTLKATTVARLVNDLRAALNDGFESHRSDLGPALPDIIRHGLKAARDEAEEADYQIARDSQILNDGQLGDLLAAAREVDAAQDRDGDLFRLVLVLAATGARFSQIVRLRVDDVQFAHSRLMVPASRKGKGKSGSIPVPVGDDILDALRPVVIGRPGNAPLLERWRLRQVLGDIRWVRADRGAWQSSSELVRPWAAIRERAGLPGAVVAYSLRHTSIVRGIRAGLPLRLVAASHDTSAAMVEKHYARWISSGLEEMTRATIRPLVPPAPGSNIVALKGGA